MKSASYYAEKARQCRRLIQTVTDERAIDELTAFAAELEDRARAVEMLHPADDMTGDGVTGRTSVRDESDPS